MGRLGPEIPLIPLYYFPSCGNFCTASALLLSSGLLISGVPLPMFNVIFAFFARSHLAITEL